MVDEKASLEERANKILVADNGTQYGWLYKRKFERLGYAVDFFDVGTYQEDGAWVRPELKLEDTLGYAALVIAGGKSSVRSNPEQRPAIDPRIYTEFPNPLLGTCFGMQDAVDRLGGVVAGNMTQSGPVYTEIDRENPLFAGLEQKTQRVNCTHNDGVATPPPGFSIIAESINEVTEQQSIEALCKAPTEENDWRFLTMFHPETWLTTDGEQMLNNFAQHSGLSPQQQEQRRQGSLDEMLETAYDSIRKSVGEKKVFLPISGGIDSTVSMAMLLEAGVSQEQVYAFHIDTGFNRLLHTAEGPVHESEEVVRQYRSMGWNVELIDAKEFFAEFSLSEKELPAELQGNGYAKVKLKDAKYSELKRILFQSAYNTIIGQQMKKKGFTFENSVWAQGTNQADKVESARGGGGHRASALIKTHHNVGALSDEYRERGLLVEPVQWFFKSDIYQIAKRFELSDFFSKRRPFPGPGDLIRGAINDVLDSRTYSEQDLAALSSRANEFSELYGVRTIITPIEMVGSIGDERANGVMAVLLPKEGGSLLEYINVLRHVAGQLPHYATISKDTCLTRFIAPVKPELIGEDVHALDLTNTGAAKEDLKHFDYEMNRIVDRIGIPMTQVVDYVTAYSPDGEHPSFVFRPWLAPDLMSGMPLIPGDTLGREPFPNVISLLRDLSDRDDRFTHIFYDLTFKPAGGTEPM